MVKSKVWWNLHHFPSAKISHSHYKDFCASKSLWNERPEAMTVLWSAAAVAASFHSFEFTTKKGSKLSPATFSLLLPLNFLNGPTRPLFCLFLFFSNTHFYSKTLGFSRIRTRIVRVEGEHADCLTTTTDLPLKFYFSRWNQDQKTLTIWGRYHCTADLLFNLLNEEQFYLFGQIQSSQTGGQRYNDSSPYGEYSLSRHAATVGVCLSTDHIN